MRYFVSHINELIASVTQYKRTMTTIEKEGLLNKTVLAIRQILIQRYFNSERGFVPEFYSNLRGQLENSNLFPEHTILETEVQKRRLLHGVRQRPDLLIHIPIETGLTNNVAENNFVVYAFKLNGNAVDALEDFEKLDAMFGQLNYEMGIYVNIGTHPTIFLNNYIGNFKDRIHEFSIRLDNEQVLIKHCFFRQNNLITDTMLRVL